MKKILLFLVLITLGATSFSQSTDSLLFESDVIVLTKNLETNRFSYVNLATGEQIDNLNFVKRIFQYFQVLDENNELFYLSIKGVKSTEVDDYLGLCGSVGHYTMTVEPSASHFEIYLDETFYDYENKIPAEKIKEVSKSLADSVLFINGQKLFRYTENFGYEFGVLNPQQLILVKDGFYFTLEEPDEKLNTINFMNYQNYLLTQKGDLVGLLGIITPKYKKIKSFKYYLAEAITTSNEVVYIDLEGNEYTKVKN